MANSSSGESVLHRIVRIIGNFDSEHSARSIAALARRTGLPMTTTHRLVNELLAEGLLQKTEDGRVQLGVRLWELGSRGSTIVPLREAALPFMEDVQSIVRQHTTLGILDNDQLLYVDRLIAGSSAVSIAKIAGRLALHGSSSGLVLLAYSSKAYQDMILAKKLKRFTNYTVTDPLSLRRNLAEIRQTGYAFMQGISIPESSGIAVPIRNASNEVVAALNVIVPFGEEDIAVTVPVLKTAARGISRAIGWRG